MSIDSNRYESLKWAYIFQKLTHIDSTLCNDVNFVKEIVKTIIESFRYVAGEYIDKQREYNMIILCLINLMVYLLSLNISEHVCCFIIKALNSIQVDRINILYDPDELRKINMFKTSGTQHIRPTELTHQLPNALWIDKIKP